ncbi:MAG: hypothetical protein ABEN55_00615 [Bradymonadaceae bacterium]
MSFEIATFPEIPSHTQVVDLDGVEYRLNLLWRQRTSSWYLSLYDVRDNPIAVGRRLSPLFTPLWNILDGPPGILLVRGPADYDRFDLGDTLKLVYVTESELQPPEPSDETIRLK